jgi:hypothetical protein
VRKQTDSLRLLIVVGGHGAFVAAFRDLPQITMLATEGQNMVTSAERMRALRERQRRGLRKLRIEVSEDARKRFVRPEQPEWRAPDRLGSAAFSAAGRGGPRGGLPSVAVRAGPPVTLPQTVLGRFRAAHKDYSTPGSLVDQDRRPVIALRRSRHAWSRMLFRRDFVQAQRRRQRPKLCQPAT